MNVLTPRIKPTPPESLKVNVLSQIRKRLILKSIKYAAVAALLGLPFVIQLEIDHYTRVKALNLFIESSEMTKGVKTMVMKYMLRTRDEGNFEEIILKNDFVENTLTKSFETQQWRIEQPTKAVLYDGQNTFLWYKRSDKVHKGEGAYNVLGELLFLLEPECLRNNAHKLLKARGTKVNLKESNDHITLTIASKARDRFPKNYYYGDISIYAADNKQIITFDKATKLLHSIEIYIFRKDKYINILNTTDIQYNVPVDSEQITYLPENHTLKELYKPLDNPELIDISARDAVVKILEALHKNDITPIKDAFVYYEEVLRIFCPEYFGLEVLEIGKAYKSKDYFGELVPVKLKLTNGEIKETNLALRNDNKRKVWILAGGI